MQGVVTGTQPGDSVKVWFTGAGQTSESFTYAAKVESTNRVLVLAAEDYTGLSPVYKSNPRPAYLSYYLDALAAGGYGADVYDVDANGREAPSLLGVLSHYNAVDLVHGRRRDHARARDGARARRRASPTTRCSPSARTSTRAAVCSTRASTRACRSRRATSSIPRRTRRAIPTARPTAARRLSDDFLQYYLGAYLYNEDAGTTSKGTLYDVLGVDNPFNSLGWSFGSPSANNQDHSASFIATSGILPKAQFPQFDSWAAAKYVRPGGPFDPHTGTYYAYSNIADISYKRLTRTITVPRRRRQPLVLDLARHRARLGLHVRRGAHGGPERLDDAAGRERAHEPEHGAERSRPGELPGRLA